MQLPDTNMDPEGLDTPTSGGPDRLLDDQARLADLEHKGSGPESRCLTFEWHVLKRIARYYITFLLLYVLLLLAIHVVISIRTSVNYTVPPTKIEHNTSHYPVKIDNAPPDCETIHLTSICGGHRSTREFYTLLKSILFHRRGYKIHYHLFVDNISERTLKKLFETWSIPDMLVDYYNLAEYEHRVSWIPNAHYSGPYGLLKLEVPTVLNSRGISKVIILDTDMVVLGDLKLLWREFSSMTTLLGLVENQSDWYLKNEDRTVSYSRAAIWPAVGRGFNTGVALVNVSKADKISWDILWKSVATSELTSMRLTSLADQDVFNIVAKKRPHLVTKLPCYMNIQLNNHTDIYETCKEFRDQEITIVHWNSPLKLKTGNNLADYFASWHSTYNDFNAGLLERTGCPGSDQSNAPAQSSHPTATNLHDPCANFHPNLNDRLRTFLYYNDFEVDARETEDGITSVVHLSFDRFQALDDLASHWTGPISAAIYLSDGDLDTLVQMIEKSITLSSRKNIGYHLVFSVPGWHYPINRLRNIALANVVTPYVFLTDVDFLPCKDFSQKVKQIIEKLPSRRHVGRELAELLLVVPAFETNQYKLKLPESKEALKEEVARGTIKPFRNDIWRRGQAQTDYSRWLSIYHNYLVKWSADYEPFVVAGRDVPKFDERFIGFGWNKVEHVMQLHNRGYSFEVLSDVFIIHQDHPASVELKLYRNDRDFHNCISHLKKEVGRSILLGP